MGVTTTKYVKKPLFVDAVRITEENFDEMVAWCQGEVLTDDPAETSGPIRNYIKVRLRHQPKYPRQSRAYVGDWLLYNEQGGYKVYTNKAFVGSFDPVGVPTPNGDGVEATLERPPVEQGEPAVSDSDSAPPPQTETGQRIITVEEQNEMGPDEVAELLKSGNAVLAQDLA